MHENILRIYYKISIKKEADGWSIQLVLESFFVIL